MDKVAVCSQLDNQVSNWQDWDGNLRDHNPHLAIICRAIAMTIFSAKFELETQEPTFALILMVLATGIMGDLMRCRQGIERESFYHFVNHERETLKRVVEVLEGKPVSVGV